MKEYLCSYLILYKHINRSKEMKPLLKMYYLCSTNKELLIYYFSVMKSKLTAYVLWFFFGLLGIHKFYLGKFGMGILYLLTGGLCGIGLLIDLFTLGGQVDNYNALFMAKSALIGGRVQQPIVVNVNNPTNPTSEQNVDSTASSYASKDNLLDEH